MSTSHWLFKPILFFVCIASFVLSWIYTINLLTASATTGIAIALAFCLASTLEPAKIVFMALGVTHHNLLALIVAIVLTVMSIIGTLGFLTVEHARKMEIATKESTGFKSIQAQISGMEAQIVNLQNAANSLPPNYHTRRQQLLDEANAMIASKEGLTQQLTGYQVSGYAASNALYVQLGSVFGLEPSFIELSINFIYGILLELVAVISGVYVFQNSGVLSAGAGGRDIPAEIERTQPVLKSSRRNELSESLEESLEDDFDTQVTENEPVKKNRLRFHMSD